MWGTVAKIGAGIASSTGLTDGLFSTKTDRSAEVGLAELDKELMAYQQAQKSNGSGSIMSILPFLLGGSVLVFIMIMIFK